MKRLPPQGAKNHHLQRAGKEISLFAIFHGGECSGRLDSSDVSLGLEQNSMKGFDSSQGEKGCGDLQPSELFSPTFQLPDGSRSRLAGRTPP